MTPITYFLVGGSLRDRLLNLPSKDQDFAVEAPSFEAMRDDIIKRGGQIFLETPAFFTVRAKMPGIGCADFVLCRRDGIYKDGRRPLSVEPGTILDDLARRDATVNALAENVSTKEIIDPFDGMTDLKNKVLRAVGNPYDRFKEDKLRILRFIRFAVTKEFTITFGTIVAMQSFDDLDGVSPERIREELLKAFQHSTVRTLEMLDLIPRIKYYIFKKTPLWLRPTL